MLKWEEIGSRFIVNAFRSDSYDIVVETGIRKKIASSIDKLARDIEAREIVLVTDTRVAHYWQNEAMRALDEAGIKVHALILPNGEQFKSVDTLTRLWNRLLELQVSRRALIIAYGGGVICDLAGFVAATFMRGLPYINVPTSLMAQIDGAIGGKVAVDHPGGKNLLGAFYHPRLVLIDPHFLATLQRRELISGLAEAIKVAVIASRPLLDDLRGWVARGLSLDPVQAAESIIKQCVGQKLKLLESDPFELSDLDRMLNLGHEIGHALETVTNYQRYLHGEAVGVGLGVAARLAAAYGICRPDVTFEILDLLESANLQTAIPAELVSAVWSHLDVIRCIRNGSLRVVVPVEVGQCTILKDIERHEYEGCALDGRSDRRSFF